MQPALAVQLAVCAFKAYVDAPLQASYPAIRANQKVNQKSLLEALTEVHLRRLDTADVLHRRAVATIAIEATPEEVGCLCETSSLPFALPVHCVIFSAHVAPLKLTLSDVPQMHAKLDEGWNADSRQCWKGRRCGLVWRSTCAVIPWYRHEERVTVAGVGGADRL